MTLFLIHSALLLAASFAAARALVRPAIDRLIATALLGWGNVVVTSLLLSVVRRLGEPDWFFRASLLLAAATWLLARRFAPEPSQETHDSARPDGRLVTVFLLTLLPIIWICVRIAATYAPNNYDTLAYHLPRAMYYLGQGNLAHFDTGNPRQTFFPFNYNLLQLFGLIYGPPFQVLNFINLAAWALAGAAVYRLGRLCSLGPNACLVATWLALTSTQVLAQATATTNDLPTGAGLLAALTFALRWWRTKLTRDALFAGLAAGLAIGTKLTVIFFAPAAGLIFLGLAWRHGRRGELGAFLSGVRAWLAPGLLAFALASPFALINLAEKGQWINNTYDYTLNRPFSLSCVVQTSKAYLVQLFLEPLHRFTFDLQFTERLNAWGSRVFFPQWNEAHAFSPFYLFPPDLNEDHVWFGFAGPFIFLSALFCLLRFRRIPPPVVGLAALGLGWVATYFVLNKWSLYNQRYFVPAVLVMSPCVAFLAQAGWEHARLRRVTRYFFTLLALGAVWLAGIYLFKNTSRPYAPLWAGQHPPPALPAMPELMVERLRGQPRVNIDSTDGNERIFLLMTHGRGQRFTARDRTDPAAYNVFSQWGFPRKVAYSNIEQLSSYTVVHFPTKRTAGVESLGSVGRGGDVLDYYGLAPHPERVAASIGDRNVLVVLYYAPRGPDRYARLRVKIAGLNAPDEARLVVGVDYEDHTSADLAEFTATGEARASVTKPFRRFTVRVESRADGAKLGSINIPYLFRDLPPEVEAPDDPELLFAYEMVLPKPHPQIATEGLAPAEGPYPQWQMPLIRWAKAPVVRLEILGNNQASRLEVPFSLRLEARTSASIDVVFNNQLVQGFQFEGRHDTWFDRVVQVTPQPGKNVLEFRYVSVGAEPDWLDYLERYPDVKDYLVSQGIPFEKGARDHYEMFGRRENRIVNNKRQTVELDDPKQLYYVFRSLRLHAFQKP